MAPIRIEMFTIATCVIAALNLGIGETLGSQNWDLIEATGSYVVGNAGKSCHIVPYSFEVRADGKEYSSSQYNLTGSMDEDCGFSITWTFALDERSTGIAGPPKTSWMDDLQTNLENELEKLDEERTKLDKEMEGLRKQGQELQKERAELDKQKAALQAMGSEKAEEIAKLDQELAKYMKKLADLFKHLERLSKEVGFLEAMKMILESRVKLLENRERLMIKKKNLDEEKTELESSVTNVLIAKTYAQQQLDGARQKVNKERMDWEEKLRKRLDELEAKKMDLKQRRQRLKSRRDALKKSAADRAAAIAEAVEKQNNINKQLEDVQKRIDTSKNDTSAMSKRIQTAQQNCEVASFALKTRIVSILGVGIDQAWVCSRDPYLIS